MRSRGFFLLVLAAAVAGCRPSAAPATPTAGPAPTATLAAPAALAPQPTAAEPPALYLTVMDANAAFARKDFSTALLLYRQATADESRAATQRFVHRVPPGPDLRAFARFRIVVADALVGQDDDARATLEQARRQDADTPFLRLGLVFWDTYGMTADPHPACAQVTRLVQADPEPVLRSLNNWGQADLAPGDVCKIPDP